ncbi:hypothetical protein BH23VER1_BH23VER1_06080 [soil metagenome]
MPAGKNVTCWEGTGYDGPGTQSPHLQGLDIAAINRCLALPTWREARRSFRESLRGE